MLSVAVAAAWPLAGAPAVRDAPVSGASGAQREAAIALHPGNPGILLAASNDGFRPGGRMRAYSSTRRRHTASSDGAATFRRPVPVASVRSQEGAGADRHEFGDYEGLAVNGGVAHPAWTDSRDLDRLGELVYSATVRDNDLKGEACVSTC